MPVSPKKKAAASGQVKSPLRVSILPYKGGGTSDQSLEGTGTGSQTLRRKPRSDASPAALASPSPQSSARAAATSPSSPSRVGLPPSTAVSRTGTLRREPGKNDKQSQSSGGGTVDGNQKVQKSLDFVSAKLSRIDPEGPRDSDDVHSAVWRSSSSSSSLSLSLSLSPSTIVYQSNSLSLPSKAHHAPILLQTPHL
jgi:hypothetical protein